MMIRVAINRELHPLLKWLKHLKISHLENDVKSTVPFLHSKFQFHCQASQMHSHTNSRFCYPSDPGNQNNFHLINRNWTLINVGLLGYGLLSLQRTVGLSICGTNKKYYHSRSKLSLDDSLYVSYLQSIVDELKVLQEEQSKNERNFRSAQEQKIELSRYHFLVGANEVISKIFRKQTEISELKSLSSDENDNDMKKMMENEIHSLEEDILQLDDELIDVLAGDDPGDNNDIILEVSAGVGGQEAMLFCAEIFNMYCQHGLAKGWTVAIVNKDESELGGYRKASLEISGHDLYKCLKFEAGVHRVQRVPKTEKAGRVHTSTVTVSILPQPREIDIQIEKKDLKIETFRGSGPGGQSVNTTDSAVRITHLPTGTVSECKQERSQIKNKDYAMKALKMKIYQAQLEEELKNRHAIRKIQMGSRGRSEKIRTYNFQQDRVTDHRVKENLSNLPGFLGGGEGLDDLITSLAKDYKYQIVESMLEEFEVSLKKKK